MPIADVRALDEDQFVEMAGGAVAVTRFQAEILARSIVNDIGQLFSRRGGDED
jgi:hypothetical protein